MIASPASSAVGELVDGPLGDLARGHHHPGGARRGQLGDEVVERVGAGRALAGERGDGVRVDVVDDALVPVAHQPADEVRAHPPESDHAELHARILSARGRAIVCALMATEADILVIFGITGDLARKMTFEALYRLERRGDLDCRR